MSSVPFPAGSEADLAAQLRVLRALHTAGAVPAPAALRARIALARRPARHRRPMTPTRWTVRCAGVAVGCAMLAATLVLGTRGPGTPTVADAAAIAGRPSQAPVLEPVGEPRWLPGVHAAGLAYPYWEDRFGLRATGVRHDWLGGRAATTVVYTHGHRRLAYTVIAGPPVAAGADARTSRQDGILSHNFTVDGEMVVAWLRQAHTCVLTARGVSLAELIRLAAASTDPAAPPTER